MNNEINNTGNEETIQPINLGIDNGTVNEMPVENATGNLTENNINQGSPVVMNNSVEPINNGLVNNPVETQNNNEGQNNEPPKKKSGATLFIILLVVAALVAGGIFAYKYFIVSTPTKAIDKTFEVFAKKAEKAIEEMNKELKTSNDQILNKVNLELNAAGETIKLDFEAKTDKKNKLMEGNLKADFGGESLINTFATLTSDKAYFKLDQNSSNTYYLNEDFNGLFETVNIKKIDPVIVNTIKYAGDSLTKALNNDSFTETKENVKINGKQFNTTKYTTKFNEKLIKNFLTEYKEKFLNDDKLITYLYDFVNEDLNTFVALAEISDEKITKNEFKDAIKDIFDEVIEESIYIDDNTYFSYYVDGTDIVRFKIYDPEEEDYSIILDLVDGFELLMGQNEENILSIKNNDEVFQMSVLLLDDKMSFDYQKNTNKYNLVFGDIKVDGILKLEENDIEFSFKTKIDGETFNGTLKIKAEYLDNLDIKVPTDALNLESESSSEALEEEVQKLPIFALIESLMPSYNYDYDDYDFGYDNDYDFDDSFGF